jgi:hypothetical protein
MNEPSRRRPFSATNYGSHAQLKAHIHSFLMAYNFAKRLKSLKGLTPYENICKIWTTQPNRFRLNPHCGTEHLVVAPFGNSGSL